MGKYYLGTGTSQINFQVVDSTGVINDLNLSGLYLSVTGKAADADKLDGFDSSYYLNAYNLTGTFTGTLGGTIENANFLDNLDSTYFLNAKNLTGYISGNVTTNYLNFASGLNLNPSTAQVTWADTPGSMQVGLLGGNVDLNVGFQSYEFVTNRTPSTLSKGTVVYVSGAQGNRPAVSPAIGAADSTSATTFGLTAENIASMADGYVITQGILTNLNTTGFAEGAALYLSPTVSGAITSTKPQAPQHSVLVGFCVRSHQSAGEILVKIQNGLEFDELHDVRISGVQNNDIVRYNSTSGVWYNSNTLALDGTGVHYVSGSLGVGTSNPVAKLNVNGAAIVGGTAASDTTNLVLDVQGNMAIRGSNGLYFGVTSNNYNSWTTKLYSSGSIQYFNAQTFIFDNQGYGLSEFMRIAGGNIGINSTSPSTKLQINATNGGYNLFFDQGNSTPGGSNPWLGLFNNTTISAATYGWGFYDSTTDGSLQLWGKNNSTTAYHILTVLRGGNIGIGTTTPTAKLEVNGSISLTGDIRNAWGDRTFAVTQYPDNYGGSPSYYMGFKTDSTTRQFFIDNKNNDGSATDPNGAIIFRTGAIPSSRMVVNYSGNVGIGTTSPTQKLEVSGNVKVQSTTGQTATPDYIWLGNTYSDGATRDKLKIYLYNSGTEQYGFGVGSGGDVQYHSNAYHDFYVGNSNKLRINSNGSVGIGTTSPTSKLEVLASVDGYWNGSAFTVAPTGAITITNTYPGGYDPVLIFRQTDNGGTSKNAGAIGLVGQGNWAAGNNGAQISDMYFLVRNNSDGISERMRIRYDGNVGIGTASPTQKLEVSGNILATASSGARDIIVNAPYGSSAAVKYQTGGVETWRVGRGINTSTMGFEFYSYSGTAGTRMMIDAISGAVGINEGNPTYRLQVNSGTDEYQIAWKRSTSKLWALGADSAGTYITNITDSILPIYIKNGGSIGVGTTNPLNKFVISNSGNTGIEFNAGLTFGPFTDVGYIACYNRAAAAFKDLVIETNGSQYIVFKSNGSVGIGTGTPYEKLEVNGAIAATGAGTGTAAQSSAVIISWESTYGAVTSVDWGAEFKPIAIRAKTIDFQIGTGSTSSKVYIDGNGNLGVGTTTPLYNLEVAKTSAGATFFVNADMGAAGEASIIGFTSNQYHSYYKAAIIAYDPYGGSWNRRGIAFCVNGTADGTNASYANDKALYIAPDKTSTFYESVTVSKASPELSIRSVSDAAGQIQYLTLGSPTYNRAQFRSTSAGTSDGSLALYTFNAGSPTLSQTWAKDGSVTLSNANDITVGTYTTGTLQVAGGISITKALQVNSNLYTSGTLFVGSTGSPFSSVQVPQLGAMIAKGTAVTTYSSTSTTTRTPDGFTLLVGNGANDSKLSQIVFNTGSGSVNCFAFIGSTPNSGYIGDLIFGSTTGSASYSEWARILGNNGNVGIGTINPAHKLEVSGNALVSKLFVSTANASYDFYNNGTSYLNGTVNTGGNLIVGGNLTVNGTTTTVNSTVTTIDDPIFTLGGDTAPASDDNKDRGVEFRWHNGTTAKVGFFGFDDSTGYFTFIPDATNTSEVFSGTQGTIQVGTALTDKIYLGSPTYNASSFANIITANSAIEIQVDNSATLSSLMDANDTNNIIALRAPFGQNPSTTSNSNAKWGMLFVGGPPSDIGNYPFTSTQARTTAIGKAAAIYGVSEDSSAGYNRKVGLAFYTSAFDANMTEVVRIDGNGNLGIGTAGPGYKFTVYQGRIASTGYTTECYIETDNTQTTVTSYRPSTTVYADILLRTTSATADSLTIKGTSGNVGIGTTSPAAKLEVNGVFKLGLVRKYPHSQITVAVNSTGWIKLATIPNNSKVKFLMRNGSANSEEIVEFDVIGTYYLTQTYVDVKRQTYNRHVTDIRITGSNGTDKIVYVLCRTSDFAPTFTWQAESAWNGALTIHNIEETPTSTAGQFVNYSVGTATINYNSYPIVSFNGSVGVGTTSPSYKLHVIGNARLGDNGQRIYLYDDGNAHIHSTSAPLWINAEDGTSAVYINNQYNGNVILTNGVGNVGIGTASPNSKLAIAGTSTGILTVGTLTNNWGGVVAIGTTNGNGIILSKINTANDTNRVLTLVRDDTNGATITGYTNGGTSADIGFNIRAAASSYFNGGNVGIGTTTPAYKLDVNGNARIVSDVYAEALVQFSVFTNADSDQWPYIRFGANATNWDEGIIKGSSSRGVFGRQHMGIHFHENRSFGFHTSGWDTEMEINGDGKIYMKGPVGIGTASPTNAKLQISSGGISTQDSTRTFAGVTFNTAIGSSDTRTLAFNGSGGSSVWWCNSGTPVFAIDTMTNGATFWTYNAGWSQRLQLDGNGFGVNTTAPLVKLTTRSGANSLPATSGTSQSGAGLRVEGGDNAVIDIGTNSVQTWIQATDKSALNNFYYLMLNPRGGNVGVNTTSNPAYSLEVNGSFAATTKSFVIKHPTKEGKKLRYGSLEGPENGVYVRGKLKGNDTIELPEYWTKLVDADSITVNLTPIGKHQKLYVKEISDNKVTIANDGFFGGEINCFYTVFGERIDVEKLQTEVDA